MVWECNQPVLTLFWTASNSAPTCPGLCAVETAMGWVQDGVIHAGWRGIECTLKWYEFANKVKA